MAHDTGALKGGTIANVLFYGSGPFAVPAFEALVAAEYRIVALVTEPGKEKGDGPEVVAGAWRLPILEPTDLADRELERKLRAFGPDVAVAVGFESALPKALLGIGPHGVVKSHPSLLPRHRGAHAIAAAILAGDTETGVTAFLMNEKPDAGPILAFERAPVDVGETAGELAQRLRVMAAPLLVSILQGLAQGTLTPTPQNESEASEAPKIDPAPTTLDWSLSADVLSRRVRALVPWPGVVASIEGHELRVLRAVPGGSGPGTPKLGTVLQSGFDGILVACGGKTRLRITQVQPEGLRPMSPAAFVSKFGIRHGAAFE